jgi:electron transfer flavoprotein beta subunit
MPFRIYVCVKHVPDSAANIRILDKTRIDEKVTFIINPFDENAIEEAVRLRPKVGEAEVVAVTVGKQAAVETLRSALAMGADRGIHVVTAESPDSLVIARALKAAILGDGPADIIFAGKASIDSVGFQTMFRLGTALGIPVATSAAAFRLEGRSAVVESELESGGRAVIRMPLPCIIGAGKALNNPRYPIVPEIMKARKKPIQTLFLESLNLETPAGRVELLELRPAVEKRQGKVIPGTPDEAVSELIRILRQEAKVI